ncbi:hypothetical protein RhiirC2_801901 [Rhizophagus irregularis]|uniref:Uncharacterized protein n=1 Tax=Rhizophagus irregularis TaxID=588596 RepID=A0A2N1M211_9GLOM|nr:hypothetical protein RhiirC2_801901 [Rhizophagus irregularis]
MHIAPSTREIGIYIRQQIGYSWIKGNQIGIKGIQTVTEGQQLYYRIYRAKVLETRRKAWYLDYMCVVFRLYCGNKIILT